MKNKEEINEILKNEYPQYFDDKSIDDYIIEYPVKFPNGKIVQVNVSIKPNIDLPKELQKRIMELFNHC